MRAYYYYYADAHAAECLIPPAPRTIVFCRRAATPSAFSRKIPRAIFKRSLRARCARAAVCRRTHHEARRAAPQTGSRKRQNVFRAKKRKAAPGALIGAQHARYY